MAWIVSGGVSYTWLYDNTQGSSIVVSMYHVLSNTVLILLTASIGALALINGIEVVLLILIYGARKPAQSHNRNSW